MAGNPKYLELLTDIGVQDLIGPGDWVELSIAWKRLTEVQGNLQLHYLAVTAFDLIARETGSTKLKVVSEAAQLHIAKNAGYAGANNPDSWFNFRLATEFGVTPFSGVLVRLSDKWSRILSLRSDPSNERIGESLLDTLRDLAAYALIALCLLKEEQVAA